MMWFMEFLITHTHKVVDIAFIRAIPINLAVAISIPAQDTTINDRTFVTTMNVKCLSYHLKKFSFVMDVFTTAMIPTANILEIANTVESISRIKYI